MSAGLKIIVGALMEAVRRLRDVIILARVTSSRRHHTDGVHAVDLRAGRPAAVPRQAAAQVHQGDDVGRTAPRRLRRQEGLQRQPGSLRTVLRAHCLTGTAHAAGSM